MTKPKIRFTWVDLAIGIVWGIVIGILLISIMQ